MRSRPNEHLPATTCPPWRVMAVFDPQGNGGDFGYTIGLAALGHPELHMWARPTDGEDPGQDFKFSSADLASILDHFAHLLLAGDREIGDNLPVCTAVAADIERVFLDWHDVALALGCRIPWERPDPDPDQEFGPWSTVTRLT